MNIKTNIFEELNKIKNLIFAKAGTVISEQVNVNNDVDLVNKELGSQSISSENEKKIVNTIISNYKTKKDFENFLTQFKSKTGKDFTKELIFTVGPQRDPEEWNQLKTHLSTLGISMEPEIVNNRYSGVIFKGLTTQGSSENVSKKDDLWKTTYSCVLSQPGAKPSPLKNNSTAYYVGNVLYFNNGKKRMPDKTIVTYSCNTEFKKSKSQPTMSSRFAKSLSTMGIQNGKIDIPTLQTILNQLNSRQL